MNKLQIAKQEAIKLGWNPSFVNQVANLEWSQISLDRECNKYAANSKQKKAIFEVYSYARIGILSQVNAKG